LSAPPAVASDHDRARDAVRAGHVRPLSEILAGINRRFPGRVLDARLIRPGANSTHWRYRVKLLNPEGRVILLTVNARTGKVMGVRGDRRRPRNAHPRRRR
ncbi:MAG: peptidase, partial [Alphaproteobacteria bacterium]